MVLVVIFSANVFAAEDVNRSQEAIEEMDITNIYFFGTSTCPYCQDAKAFFKEYVNNNPEVTVYYFEIDKKREGSRLLIEFGKTHNQRTSAVPVIFVSEKSWVGFSSSIEVQIEIEVERCKVSECVDSFEKLENKEDFREYLKKEKYVEIFQSETREYQATLEKQEKFAFFKKIGNFFRNLFN